MNSDQEDQLKDEHDQMPMVLKVISICLTLALVALSWAIGWVWFPAAILGKVVAFLLVVIAAPPIVTSGVLEVANRISGGELRRTGNLKRRST